MSIIIEFSVLLYFQNQKLRNLRKFSFTFLFSFWLYFRIFHRTSLKNHESKALLCDMLSILIQFIWKAIDVMQKTNLLFFCKSCWHLKDYHLLKLQSRLKSNLELFEILFLWNLKKFNCLINLKTELMYSLAITC